MKYKKILLILNFILLSFLITKTVKASENNSAFEEIYAGNLKAPIEIIAYSSLTCPHCADFHLNIYPKIKEKYVDTGMVKFIFRDFPLDLAALNASKLLQCVERKQRLSLLDEIYKKQKIWTGGNNIEEINSKLNDILQQFNINKSDFQKCLINDEIEEKILNARIEGQKKYNIEATPTIVINNKKIKGPVSFKNIEKALKKII